MNTVPHLGQISLVGHRCSAMVHTAVALGCWALSGPAQAETPLWQQVGQAIAREFSDLDDVAQWTRVILRLLLAAVLGGLLGWQREAQGKSAGLRTHMLVCMGAALAVTVVQLKGAEVNELARVVQGVITGVGFLGAGTILKREDGGQAAVHGLTTAAGIWLTAAVGIAVGLGAEATAIVSAVLAFLVLALVPRLAPTPHESGHASAPAPSSTHKTPVCDRRGTNPISDQ